LVENRSAGVGDRFVATIRAAVDAAARWPDAGVPTRVDETGSVLERMVPTKGFPYVVVYRATDVDVEVLAVHHQRRRPAYWAERTSE
jgi:plasmid stabilization system protein ParE